MNTEEEALDMAMKRFRLSFCSLRSKRTVTGKLVPPKIGPEDHFLPVFLVHADHFSTGPPVEFWTPRCIRFKLGFCVF